MVRGMVDRLAERLAAEPQDLDGWLLLVTSYVKLGERDRRWPPARKAREIFQDDGGAGGAWRAKAKELGLEPQFRISIVASSPSSARASAPRSQARAAASPVR